MPDAAAERAKRLALIAEVFREHGYEGASLSLIGKATGLGKGSLYHFFPGGKQEMASTVLAEIDAWFEAHVFAPLHEADDPLLAVAAMFDSVDAYFRSGRRVCLAGVLALGDPGDTFAETVRSYFSRWISALARALTRSGLDASESHALAEDAVIGIQGALVLARALGEPEAFGRALVRLLKTLTPRV